MKELVIALGYVQYTPSWGGRLCSIVSSQQLPASRLCKEGRNQGSCLSSVCQSRHGFWENFWWLLIPVFLLFISWLARKQIRGNLPKIRSQRRNKGHTPGIAPGMLLFAVFLPRGRRKSITSWAPCTWDVQCKEMPIRVALRISKSFWSRLFGVNLTFP